MSYSRAVTTDVTPRGLSTQSVAAARWQQLVAAESVPFRGRAANTTVTSPSSGTPSSPRGEIRWVEVRNVHLWSHSRCRVQVHQQQPEADGEGERRQRGADRGRLGSGRFLTQAVEAGSHVPGPVRHPQLHVRLTAGRSVRNQRDVIVGGVQRRVHATVALFESHRDDARALCAVAHRHGQAPRGRGAVGGTRGRRGAVRRTVGLQAGQLTHWKCEVSDLQGRRRSSPESFWGSDRRSVFVWLEPYRVNNGETKHHVVGVVGSRGLSLDGQGHVSAGRGRARR